MGHTIGIDLGTTRSCVAVAEGKDLRVIHNRQGGRTLPSVVAISEEGQILVGAVAARQAVTNPKRTVFGAKRLIGRKLDDPAVAAWQRSIPYELVPAENGDAWVRIGTRSYSPQEISAMILGEIKAIAEENLGGEATAAVITVPAYFNDNQRQATKDAARIAGLEVLKIINEPTAAALGYGLAKKSDRRIAVFDLGGGTFDITILQTIGGVFEVLSSNGDCSLGGNDFDHNLASHLLNEFARAHDHDLRDDPCAMQRIREEVERAKCELSTALTSSINLPYIGESPKGPLHMLVDPLPRSLLERVNRELLQRLEAPCRCAMEDAGLSTEELDEVILVGGMSRMPAVQSKVEEIFGKKPAKSTNPDEIVALGAAAQCGIIGGDIADVVLLDVTAHSLGIKVLDDRMSVVIPRNSTIPTSETKIFGTTEDNQDYVVLEVYQGESGSVRDNTYLGRFSLEDLPCGPRGQTHVEVTFLIDANGLVNVTAREMSTGKETSVTIKPSGGLTAAQRERLTGEHRAVSGS
jgi:molecular chaperone DnaK